MSEEEPKESDESVQSGVTDTIRKAVFGSISSLFMSEESIKGQLGELPRDALNYLVGQTEKTRDEFFKIVTREFRTFLDGVDLSKELPKILQGMNIEVKANIRFKEGQDPIVDIEAAVQHDSDSEPPETDNEAPDNAETGTENE
ncbi:MAG: hypothetical protein HOI23_07760 [Deltaproteobacteria bacterium]|jgi:hypothetical protein|nr:hypothetical protein [Deltaproteobacteria bacterium]MBT6433083.1 hypothetical protein [Deltaproteobacteria bacterium]MBT6492379.1 hypothetical protein [Deltaproteobacteria bacterium]